MTPELENFIQHQQSGAGESLPEPSIPLEPVADPDMAGAASTREAALGAPDTEPELTQEEKDAYARAALLDEPVVLPIRVLGGKAVVRVRTLSIMHEDILAWWLGELEQNKSISTTVQWLTMTQRGNVLLRVVGIDLEDGKSQVPYTCQEVEALVLECSKFNGPTEQTPDGQVRGPGIAIPEDLRRRAIQALNTHVLRTYREMTPARYTLLQQAVAVHERKFNALTRLAASGNF